MEANPNNSSEQIEIDWKSNMTLFPTITRYKRRAINSQPTNFRSNIPLVVRIWNLCKFYSAWRKLIDY